MAAKKKATHKSGNKTMPTRLDPKRFVASIRNATRRQDAQTVMAMMARITGEKPRMWGSAIVGYGHTVLVYATGREVEVPLAAFSPRKDALTVYLNPGFARDRALVKKLGPCKTGKGCLYLRSLEDVDLDVLEQLVTRSAQDVPG